MRLLLGCWLIQNSVCELTISHFSPVFSLQRGKQPEGFFSARSHVYYYIILRSKKKCRIPLLKIVRPRSFARTTGCPLSLPDLSHGDNDLTHGFCNIFFFWNNCLDPSKGLAGSHHRLSWLAGSWIFVQWCPLERR